MNGPQEQREQPEQHVHHYAPKWVERACVSGLVGLVTGGLLALENAVFADSSAANYNRNTAMLAVTGFVVGAVIPYITPYTWKKVHRFFEREE
jgi:hypothetical protein